MGHGKSINLWTHYCSDVPLVNVFNIPANVHHNLKAIVSDFIVNSQWCRPLCIQQLFPSLLNHI